MKIIKEPGVYYINFYGKLVFGIVRKTVLLSGFVACYGGGKLAYGKAIYLRIWRCLIAVKSPVKNLEFFEVWWPKNYRL